MRLGFRNSGSGFRVPSSGFRVPGFGFRIPGVGFRVSVLGCTEGFRDGVGHLGRRVREAGRHPGGRGNDFISHNVSIN